MSDRSGEINIKTSSVLTRMLPVHIHGEINRPNASSSSGPEKHIRHCFSAVDVPPARASWFVSRQSSTWASSAWSLAAVEQSDRSIVVDGD